MSFHSKKCIRRKKEMCKVIAIANQKGGVGKTTTTVNLGIGLARKGKRVVLIDADPQGSMTVSLGIDEPDKIEYSLANVLMDVVNEEEIDYAKIILKHEENIDFIPANIELAGLEVSMVNVMSRELVMKRFISNIKENYDYILIDCMPKQISKNFSHNGWSDTAFDFLHKNYGIDEEYYWYKGDNGMEYGEPYVSGENIAMGATNYKDAMKQWKNSPGHYNNLKSTSHKSGAIACYESGNGTYWVALFSDINVDKILNETSK